MRVAGENEGNIQCGSFRQAPRIVGQQNRRGRRIVDEWSDVHLTFRPKSQAHDIDVLIPDRDPRAGITKHLDATSRESSRHVVIVVVVSQNAEDPLRSGQRRQRVGGGLHEFSISPRDIVAAENDELRPLGHQHADGRRDVVVRNPPAAMDVGQKTDAQTVQGGGQAMNGNGDSRDLEFVATVEESVRSGAGDSSRACGGYRSQRGAARHRSALTNVLDFPTRRHRLV